MWRESVVQVYPNISSLSQSCRYTVLMRSPRRGILGLLEGWLVYRFSLVVELFLTRIEQNFYSSERLRRYNVQLNEVVGELNFRYRRLFARLLQVTEKEWFNVVANNQCTVHLLKELHLSAHKCLVLGILVHLCRRRLMMRSQFGL